MKFKESDFVYFKNVDGVSPAWRGLKLKVNRIDDDAVNVTPIEVPPNPVGSKWTGGWIRSKHLEHRMNRNGANS